MNFRLLKHLAIIVLLGIFSIPSHCKATQILNKPDTLLIDKNSFVPLYKYVASNMRYVQSARENGTEGVIVLTFDLTEKGTIENAEVQNAEEMKKTTHGMDDEALRVIKRFKDKELVLKPGLYHLPIIFIFSKNLGMLPQLNPKLKKLPNFLNEIIITGF